MDTYTGCGEARSEMVVIAAAHGDETVGIAVELIVVDGDERAALDGILD